MKSKEQILLDFNKNYKPCFLLAWLRFLTYDEMKKVDLLEPYDAALSAKQIKSIKDWDGLVVSYTEHNLLFGLCILMRKLNNAILNENWVMGSVYANDIKNWLYILDDKEYDFDTSMSSKRIIKYYNNIAIKYKIDL